MVATYILIVLLNSGNTGFTAEFYTKDRCEIAGQAVIRYHDQRYICVEK